MVSRSGNVPALGVSEGVRVGVGLAAAILTARWLGPEGLGVVAFVNSVTGVVAFLATMGAHFLITREIARHRERAPVLYGAGMLSTVVLGLISAGLVTGYVAWRDPRPELVICGAVGGLFLMGRALETIPISVIQGVRRMPLQVPGVLAGRLSHLATLVALLMAGFGPVAAFASRAFGTLVALLTHDRMVRRRLEVRPVVRPAESVRLVRQSVPFGLNMLFGAIYLQSDYLIVKETHGMLEVGMYGAAAQLIVQLALLAQVLNKGLYPKLSGMTSDRQAAADELVFVSRLLLVVSVPVAVGGICLAEPLLGLLYGADFYLAAWPLMLLLPMLPLRFLNTGYGTVLAAFDRQSIRTRGVFYAAVFNVAANLVVVPYYGAAGAAATTLATEVLLTLVLLRWALPELPTYSAWGPLVRTLVPALPMAAAVLLCPFFPVLVRIGVGIAVYLPLAYLTGGWAPSDLRRLRQI
jgi:O-antigen/teichoic acid export membrane protein